MDAVIRTDVTYNGSSYSTISPTDTYRRRLDDYTLVDLRAEYAVTPALRLFARVENLFDENYMTAYRYGTLGRSIYAGFRGRF